MWRGHGTDASEMGAEVALAGVREHVQFGQDRAAISAYLQRPSEGPADANDDEDTS